MKTFLLMISLMLSPITISNNQTFCVVGSSCPVFAEPSYSSSQIATLEYGNELELIESETTNGFYHIRFSLDDSSLDGFAPADLVGLKQEGQQTILSYNATLQTKTDVLSPTDDSTICTLPKGTRVFLYEGYHKENDFLAIKFNFEGKVMIGRVKTEVVQPDGVNPALIVSIMAIVAVVTIIIILFGIKLKKRHKNLKTEA